MLTYARLLATIATPKTTPRTMAILLGLCIPVVRRLQEHRRKVHPYCMVPGSHLRSLKQHPLTNITRASRPVVVVLPGCWLRTQLGCWLVQQLTASLSFLTRHERLVRERLSPESLRRGMLPYVLALETTSCPFHRNHSPPSSGRQKPLTPLDGRIASHF